MVFSIFFSLVFFCALARIELLIDVLPDLEKNVAEFRRHKIVYGAICANKLIHCVVAVFAYYSNDAYTPKVKNDANPLVI